LRKGKKKRVAGHKGEGEEDFSSELSFFSFIFFFKNTKIKKNFIFLKSLAKIQISRKIFVLPEKLPQNISPKISF
jgi:hypothetical protein